MPQVLTPAVEPALLLDAEVQLWLSGGAFRTGRTIAALIADGSLSPTGAVVGSAVANYTANTNLTAVIPLDDTTPLISEGTEVLTLSITPKTITNKLRCRFTGTATAAAAANVIAAMFQGSTCIDACWVTNTAANVGLEFALEAEYTPASISAQTISVRVGPGAAGTVRMNGATTGRFFGGASNATLVVEEIKA